MLVSFSCDRCGAQLTARPEFAGQSIPCGVCRRPVMVPVVAAPAPVQQRLKRVEPEEDLSAEVLARADDEARHLAMMEAKRETLRGRAQGVVLTLFGALAAATGGASLTVASSLWIPRGSALAAVVFGGVALLIGVAVWRLALQTMHDEFRRRMPAIADRLRRHYYESRRSSPTRSPVS